MIQRTKLAHRQLPDYTRGEELFNMISHIVGGALGVAMLVLSVVFSALHKNPWAVVGSAIYGGMLIVMYTISSVYHGLRPGMAKKVMQVIDHCDIYFLIAGTYTPILLVAVRPIYPALAWVMFGIEWGLTVLAATLTAIDLKKYNFFSMTCYIGLGWLIIFIPTVVVEAIGGMGFFWLLMGGVSFTIGSVLYVIGKRKRYMHSIFHIFVNIGSILQFISILFYVI